MRHRGQPNKTPVQVSGILLLSLAACLSGCAAMITNSEPDISDVIQAGTTDTELRQRLGPPIRSVPMTPPRSAHELWVRDHDVAVLLPQEIVTTESVFEFKGRLNKQGRVAQAGFDSFMWLGLAEVLLIPKALWERMTDEELRLTVWFAADGRAVAYLWSPLPRP